jgi:hypothetical protein
MSEKKIKIDLTRHLCDTCSLCSKCEFKLFEIGENNNVIRCIKYRKTKDKNCIRVEVGEMFWHYGYVDENHPEKGFKSKCRVESKNRIDNLLYEVNNYFDTLEKCNIEIERVSKELKLK